MMGVVPCGARPGTTSIRTIYVATTATTSTIHRIVTTTTGFVCCCLAERLAEMSPACPAGLAVGSPECRCQRDAGSMHQTGPLVCPVPDCFAVCAARRRAKTRRGRGAGTFGGLRLESGLVVVERAAALPFYFAVRNRRRNRPSISAGFDSRLRRRLRHTIRGRRSFPLYVLAK